ncbi:MAG: DNA polymerase IV [Cytophagaceae bacterium]|nr:DNA polymerase IV [Cytophagaceae bacterium]
MNANRITDNIEPRVLFVDMNSFFASCEQQVNYWLRGRPVAVCVYVGQRGCVIAPSIEAKQRGVKLGMRLDEAMKRCPDLVPIETNPERYREFHVKIIDVLKKFSDDVLPKSIDEAVVDLTRFRFVHKDPVAVARAIKQAIRIDVGDWLRCSIGVAPNVFLAKLGTEIQKPDGLVVITPDTIDAVLATLQLTDLPGIGLRMAAQLERGGVHSPLELRYASPDRLRAVCKSIVGWHWHLRLNFGGEVDMASSAYKSMQAMRTISAEQRRSAAMLMDILTALCLTLERRMVRQEVFARMIFVHCGYDSGRHYADEVRLEIPLQDGVRIQKLVIDRMERFRRQHLCEPVLNAHLTRLCVGVNRFVSAEAVQYTLFEESSRNGGSRFREDKLRKTVYDIKDRFGSDKLLRAAQLSDSPVWRDVIGFGSIKDLHGEETIFGKPDAWETSPED